MKEWPAEVHAEGSDGEIHIGCSNRLKLIIWTSVLILLIAVVAIRMATCP